jgi:hypothetical protein
MAKRIVLKPGIRIATALALLAAVISSSQSARIGSRPVRDQGLCARFMLPSSYPSGVSAVIVTAQHDRLKAISSESEWEPGETINQNRSVFDVPASSRTQPAWCPGYSGPFRPDNPLRC